MTLRRRWARLLLGGVLMAAGGQLVAAELQGLLERMLADHDRVRKAEADRAMAGHQLEVAKGGWYPELRVTANYGQERRTNPDSDLAFHEADLRVSQLLWDFGATDAAVSKQQLGLEESGVALAEERQKLLLEGASAFVNWRRAERVLGYSRQSEGNVQRQTGLEEIRVAEGSGFTSDVLQAKSQLAGTRARRIQAEGNLETAANRFRSVFSEGPEPHAGIEISPRWFLTIPPTLEEALSTARERNPELARARLKLATARQEVRAVEGRNWYPRIEAVVEQKWKEGVQGVNDAQQERLAKVELSMPFNLGLTARDAVGAAGQQVASAQALVDDTGRRIEEQVRNAWRQLQTAELRAVTLEEQATIAAAFLELAREERKLGQRSLIDVLAGETSLNNAQSDAESARADVLVARFTLLHAIGLLGFPGPP